MATSLVTGSGRGGGKNRTCGVCQETYRSPRFLPCFHTFCLYCVDGLARTHGQSFPCPQCRKLTAVPPEGALGFQINFYITEEELEHERKGPSTAVCATHPMEPLVFFCVQCDQAICIRCKLTKHNEHRDTEDLSEAAARCAGYLEKSKDRLDSIIILLSKTAALAQDSLREAKQKGTTLKQQAQMQRDLLVQRIDTTLAMVLSKLDTSNTGIEERLTLEAQSVQQELDSLVQLRQSVHLALTAEASDTDKVSMEKEMREGKGSEEHLRSIKENIPATTFRPGVHFDGDRISEEDIHHVLGHPVTLSMSSQASNEIIVPVFQYTQRQSKEVYGVCQVGPERYIVLIWDRLAHQSIRFNVDEEGRLQHQEKITAERESVKRFIEQRGFRSTFEFCNAKDKGLRLNSKSYHTQMFQVEHIPRERTSVVRLEVMSNSPFRSCSYFIQETNLAEPAAFDATATGDLFALVEIPQGQQSLEDDQVKRQVCLYRNKQNRPFATYTPDDLHFSPSDVCFCRENDEDKLLVADRQNDRVHVVSIQDDEVHFERYLAAGDSNIVRPTALNIDDKGRIWIGCETGHVLMCETQGQRAVDHQSNAVDESTADNDSNTSVVSEDSSAGSCLMMVENSSQSTQSPMSEDT